MRTYIQGDEERTCPCNYFMGPVVIDCDNLIIYCSVCGHSDKLPSYSDFLTEDELMEYYDNPKKKVYDFGMKDPMERIAEAREAMQDHRMETAQEVRSSTPAYD